MPIPIAPPHYLLPLQSKREVYNFLSVDFGVYLPAYEQVSIYFLKDIINNKKKRGYPNLGMTNQTVL